MTWHNHPQGTRNQTTQPRRTWLRTYKKGARKPTVTNAQALDVALCWGWIDGIRKAFDDDPFRT